MTAELEFLKLELEEKWIIAEIESKKRELDLKEKELEDKRLHSKRERRILWTLLLTAIAGGLLAFSSVGLTTYSKGYWPLSSQKGKNEAEAALKQQEHEAMIILKRDEQQFQIIIKSTENQSPEEAIHNLKYFLDIGVLLDPDGKIKKKAEEGLAPIINYPRSSVENAILKRYLEMMSKEGYRPIKGTDCQVENHFLVNKEGIPIF